MRADRVEVSWDNDKKKWLVRIIVGEEVIRRYCDAPRDADEQKIRAAAQKTLADGLALLSQGIGLKVVRSGCRYMSLSWMRANPSTEEPSNQNPWSSASSKL